ncbi:outer membrane beta-barrel protein [Leeia aquatica]|uniref:Porin family protein n=1 Tax=Leeia aquatica TaxID=2725557 RepID=A0A847RVZ4_9NEIS|nr:outer membrane beta-barrel protein [Leeia aquatica]NLR75350.1 porin family protein [Leeia aquatica]
MLLIINVMDGLDVRTYIRMAVSLGFMSAGLVQAEPFVGPMLSIGLGSSSNQVQYDGFVKGDAKERSAAADIEFNYGWSLGQNWNLSAGTAFDLNKRDFSTIAYTWHGAQSVHGKLKQHWSVYIEPGYLVRPDVLVYGKLAYHTAKGEYIDSGAPSGTRNHHGTGVGIGVRYALSNHLELAAELQQVRLSRESANASSGKPKFTEAMLRLGYRF